jgi:hypothetical protein
MIYAALALCLVAVGVLTAWALFEQSEAKFYRKLFDDLIKMDTAFVAAMGREVEAARRRRH